MSDVKGQRWLRKYIYYIRWKDLKLYIKKKEDKWKP